MGDFLANVAKGRFAEFAERVNSSDPADAVLVIMALDASGVESDAVLKDKDTFADWLSGATSEATNAGYARKVIDQAGGITRVVDDTNDRVDVDVPDQTWTGVAAGTNWSDLVFGYDPDSTSGTDASIVPVSQHDFPITADGSDVTATINVFARAS